MPLPAPPVARCSKLLLHLPRTVDADHGRARWDAAKRVLAVSAPIVPEGLLG